MPSSVAEVRDLASRRPSFGNLKVAEAPGGRSGGGLVPSRREVRGDERWRTRAGAISAITPPLMPVQSVHSVFSIGYSVHLMREKFR